MKIINKQGATTVSHPVFGIATADADGVFELEHDFAEELLKWGTQWGTEHTRLVEAEPVDQTELHDPLVVAEGLEDLRAEVAALRDGHEPEAAVPVAEGWRAGRWAPDPRTFAYCSAIAQNDGPAITEWWRLVLEADELRTRLAAARVPAEVEAPVVEPVAAQPAVAAVQAPEAAQ